MILSSNHVYVSGKFVPASIQIENGKIIAIEEKEKNKDFDASYIVPGFIDIHTHGGYGFEIMDANMDQARQWLNNLGKEGTTSVLLTPYTSSIQRMRESALLIQQLQSTSIPCDVLGIHLEGPFLSKQALGAMNEDYILKPDQDICLDLIKGLEDEIKIMTLAIEEDTDFRLMDNLHKKGIRISCGHSIADYETCKKAQQHGLNSFTHTYNAMRGLHHREVGTTGASMLLDDCYSECIVDGKHVCYEALEVLFRTKPHNKLIFVTDSLSAKGLKDGIYDMDGLQIEIIDGLAYLYGTSQIAGSTVGLHQCVQNAVQNTSISLEHAIDAVTINPAAYIGIDNKKGSISIGKDADLCILDQNLKVLRTYSHGNLVFQSI